MRLDSTGPKRYNNYITRRERLRHVDPQGGRKMAWPTGERPRHSRGFSLLSQLAWKVWYGTSFIMASPRLWPRVFIFIERKKGPTKTETGMRSERAVQGSGEAPAARESGTEGQRRNVCPGLALPNAFRVPKPPVRGKSRGAVCLFHGRV